MTFRDLQKLVQSNAGPSSNLDQGLKRLRGKPFWIFDQQQHMIFQIWKLKNKCDHVSNIYVDAANPEVWQALKKEFGEPYNEQYIRDQVADCKKYNLHIEDRMFVVPVPFSIEGAKMLQHCKWLLEENDEDGSSLIAIHPSFEKLLTALRTAVANEYKLDKEQTSYNDILDAFRLSLQFYKRSK